MRTVSRVAVLIAAMAILSPSLGTAQEFEGTVTVQQITADEAAVRELIEVGEEGEIDPETLFDVPVSLLLDLAGRMDQDVDVSRLVYSIKGQLMRVDGIGQGAEEGYALIDYGSGVIRLVNPIEGSYIEWGKEDIEQLRSMFPDVGEEEEEEAAPSASVRALDEWRDVNGMACEMYRIETGGMVTAACVSPDMTDLVGVFEEFEARMAALELIDPETDEPEVITLVAEQGFPVMEQTLYRYEEYGGFEYEVSEIISVERRSLDDELFQLPADYEKRGLMDMFRGAEPPGD